MNIFDIRAFNFTGGGASSLPFNFATLPANMIPVSSQYKPFNGTDNVIKHMTIVSGTGDLELNKAATGFNSFLIEYTIEI